MLPFFATFMRFAAVCVICTLCLGCFSPWKGVAKREQEIAEQMSEELLRIENLEEKKIGWKEAVELMEANSVQLLESRNQVKVAEEALSQVYRDLIPGGSLSAGLNTAFTDLANLDGDDFGLSIFGFFNLPGVVTHQIRQYSRTLELIRAQWAYELSLRQETIRLHEQFLQYQLLLERTKNLALTNRFQERNNLLSGLDTTPQAIEQEEFALTLERQSRSMQSNIARLLGSNRYRWVLDDSSLPSWDYSKRPLELENPKEFGVLYRQLQALQLEGQRLTKWGVKLRYWPDLRMNISSPPLYTVGREGRNDFDLERVFVSLDAAVQLDTRLSIWTQLEQVKRRTAIDQKKLEQDNSVLIEQLLANQDALELKRKQIRLNEIRLKFLRKQERSLDPQKNRDQLEKSIALSEQQASLVLERTQLEASFWLLDERRWDRIQWDKKD